MVFILENTLNLHCLLVKYKCYNMPQLVKGGKNVFGWTTINNDLKVRIPDEAFEEYNFIHVEKIIVMSGSKPSGGFSIYTPDSIIKSKLGRYITNMIGYSVESDSFVINKLEIVKTGERLISWTSLDNEKYLSLSNELLDLFGLMI